MTRLRVSTVTAFAAIAVGAGCSTLPNPTASTYLKATGCGFVIYPKEKQIVETIVVGKVREFPVGATVYAEFEDPSDPTTPLTAFSTVRGDEHDFVLRSPPLKGLRNRTYSIAVSLRTVESNGNSSTIDALTQQCRSTFNQADLSGY